MKKTTVLSCDPGKTNFAFCLSEHELDGTRHKVRIIRSGILENTESLIRDLNSNKLPDIPLYREVSELVSERHLDLFVAERFMSRGIKTGNTAEIISLAIMMLVSLIQRVYPDCDCALVTAAQWKKSFNGAVKPTNGGLDKLYKLARVSNHQLDAALIGLYAEGQRFETPLFQMIKNRRSRNIFLENLEETSQTKLINRRKKRKN